MNAMTVSFTKWALGWMCQVYAKLSKKIIYNVIPSHFCSVQCTHTYSFLVEVDFFFVECFNRGGLHRDLNYIHNEGIVLKHAW